MGPGGASLDAARAALGEPCCRDPAYPPPQNPSLTCLTASHPLCRVLLRFLRMELCPSVDSTMSTFVS